MTGLRYVCLSDMHLGAAYSLLTHIDDAGAVSLDQPAHTLTALADGLRATAARLAGDTPPTLVLMGDVLDMGLSKSGEVAKAFFWFIDALFPAGGPKVFSDTLLCLPGNHDHHLWRMAQDEHWLSQLGAGGELPGDLIDLTPLLAPPTLTCRLLTRLMRTRDHLSEAKVMMAYPNFGMTDADGHRAVVLHHGHYVDSMYRSMSRLQAWLDDSTAPPRTVHEIEAQNGPWVDFLWSDLGSAGALGRSTTSLYETMLDAGASHAFAGALADRVTAQLAHAFGLRADMALSHGLTVAQVIRGLIDLTAGRAAESQRNGYRTVLSTAERQDLAWYIGGPVASQLAEEGAHPKSLSFVFGHTHKPFQDEVVAKDFDQPVSVYNTGGWVLDVPTLMPCQGGAAILIDDALNVASLRLFNDPIDGDMHPVSAQGAGGFRDAANPLLKAAAAAVEADRALWDAFSDRAKFAIEKRAGVNLERFVHPGSEALKTAAVA